MVVADLDGREAARVAAGLACPSPLGAGLDVTDQAAVAGLVDRVEEQLGPVDLWCSNAGVALGRDLGTDGDWERSFAVHVLAHVHLARVLAPRMAARGRGHLLLTASAAGLLTNMDSAPYSVTKHGTVALAEWLAIRWGDAGVGVSCLCPQGVRTAMTEGMGAGSSVLAAGALLEPAEVAEAVVGGLADGRFLILPHPEVAELRAPPGRRPRPLAGRHAPRPGAAVGAGGRLNRGGSAGGGPHPRRVPGILERPAEVRPGAPVSGGRRYTSRLASFGLSERPRPDLSGQSRPLCPGDCWTCSTAGEPPLESGDLPELLNALVANSTTASPASTVATRMARQGRHPVRAVVTGSSGKRASFSRRP